MRAGRRGCRERDGRPVLPRDGRPQGTTMDRHWTRIVGLATAGMVAAGAAAAQAPAAAKPERGGTLVFPVHAGEPETFDCHAATAIRVMQRVSPHYSQLLRLDPERHPTVQGDLARSWTVSADGKRYEFKLHDNVRFHNGTVLTAHDVKASFDRMRNPPPGLVSLRRAMLEDIASIDAPDAGTVVFRLHTPNAAMLQVLAMPYACIYSARLLAEDPAYPARKVMGTGPFKFVRYQPGVDWVGERFADYFRSGLPYLDGFRAVSVTVPGALSSVVAGQVHFNVKALTDGELAQVKAARGAAVDVVGEKTAIPVGIWLVANVERPPLDDVRVRRAIHLAIDRWTGSQAMRNFTPIHLVGGLSRPGSPFARSEAELLQVPGFGRDVEAARKEARRLLAEAGHTNLKLTYLNNRNFSFYAVFLADQLRHVGITLDTQMVDPATYVARKREGGYDITTDSPPEYLDDPTVQWSVLKSRRHNPANYAQVNDARIDVLYEMQKRATDPRLRLQRVREMEDYILGQAYAVPLFWGGWTRTISKTVGGLGDTPTNFSKLDLADIWLRGDKKP